MFCKLLMTILSLTVHFLKVLFQASSYPVPTKFTLYAFIAHGYD